MPMRSRRPFLAFAVGAATVLAASLAGPALPAAAQPSLPATFFGTASIDGAAPRAGAEVRGFVDGKDCTQGAPGERSIVIEGGIGKYVIHVVHESQIPGCGREGKTVTFTIDGRPAGQSAKWKAGPQPLDLNAGPGSPVPLPTDVPTVAPPPATPRSTAPVSGAAAGGSPAPSAITPPPTDDIPNPLTRATAAVVATGTPPTPLAPGGVATPAATASASGGGGAWVYLLIGAGSLALAGGVGGFIFSRRSSHPPAS